MRSIATSWDRAFKLYFFLRDVDKISVRLEQK